MTRLFHGLALALITAASLLGKAGWAQEAAPQEAAVESEGTEAAALLAPEDLEVLVSRIAFYPDEVVAVTLPAATYPLDVVQAARFLEQRKTKPDMQPDANWDTSVVALINYPVVISMMNDDLDWTTALGEAVLNQQADVIDAIQQVRRGAYTAGFLKSDDKNTVTVEQDAIVIAPADPKVVYVPVYEPAPAPEQLPAEPAATEEPATGEATTVEGSTTVVNNNVYYPPSMSYSEPYTPYYDQTASFWTGALVGGMAVGFLMNWDDDDIDIDFNDGDFDNWGPGRGDVNINGDVNIGNDTNIGNGVRVDKGDSWRKTRDQKVASGKTSQLNTKRPKNAAARPAASLQPAGAKTLKGGQTGAATNLNKKQLQTTKANTARTKTPESRKPTQKPSALGNVERGQQTVKDSRRGANSQQKAINRAPSKQQSLQRKPSASASAMRPTQKNTSAFGNMSSGKQARQSSKRGSSSQKRPKRR